jgi:hypothetical protein
MPKYSPIDEDEHNIVLDMFRQYVEDVRPYYADVDRELLAFAHGIIAASSMFEIDLHDTSFEHEPTGSTESLHTSLAETVDRYLMQ